MLGFKCFFDDWRWLFATLVVAIFAVICAAFAISMWGCAPAAEVTTTPAHAEAVRTTTTVVEIGGGK